MNQLGQSLKRTVVLLTDKQQVGYPCLFSKLDIKDVFWRMIISDENSWNFCYALPSWYPEASVDYLRIVIPNSLQMGWYESLPFLCAATYTAQDVIQRLLHTNLPHHKFEAHVMPLPQEAATYVNENSDLLSNDTLPEVFIDVFIALTDNLTHSHLLQVSRAILCGINAVFLQLDVTCHNGGDPISE